jgi:hypothetical protein
MPDDTRWMTYDELAKALGIGGDSARNLVRRKRWSRRPGNDGLARVGVPVEHLTEHAPTDARSDGAIDPPADPPTDAPADGGIIPILNRHVERLEAEVKLLQSELFVERATAAQVGALQAVLAIERQRIAELRQERDRLLDRMLTPPAPGVWARLRRAMGG